MDGKRVKSEVDKKSEEDSRLEVVGTAPDRSSHHHRNKGTSAAAA